MNCKFICWIRRDKLRTVYCTFVYRFNLNKPMVHCFACMKVNSLEKARKAVLERAKDGKVYAYEAAHAFFDYLFREDEKPTCGL